MNPALRYLCALRDTYIDRLNAAARDLYLARQEDDDYEASLIEVECDTWLMALSILDGEMARAEKEAPGEP